MNLKKIWLVIPTVAAPYIVLLCLALIFSSTEVPAICNIMENVFKNSIWNLMLALLIYFAISLLLATVCFIISICKGYDALSLAKPTMIIKLIQIPAYITIFVLGVIFFITVFTAPFSLALFLLDCLMLFMTGLLNCAAVIVAIRQGFTTFKQSFWVIILQFVFCADVVASIIFYSKIKKKYKLCITDNQIAQQD